MQSRFLVTVIFSWCLTASLLGQSIPRRTFLVRVDGVKYEALEKTGFVTYDEYQPRSLLSLVRDTAVILTTRTEAELLRERGFHTTVLLEDTNELQLVRRGVYGPTMRLEKPYHSYASIMAEAESLRRAHPSRVEVFPIGTTVLNEKIYAIKIARNVRKEEDRPAILFNGCHHSNEVAGAEICLALIHELVGKYGSDPDVTRWVDNFTIYVVPVVNVDGHNIVTSGQDPRWRKNARDTGEDGVIAHPDGVDLNRTYDFNWAHGGAAEPGSVRYRGPYPFSEPETRAFAELARTKRFLLSVTYHSQGEVIYYPWVWGDRKAPDDRLLTSIARGLAGSITTMRGDTCYKAEYGAGLVGQSYTWLYGVLGTLDFVVETGRGASIMPPWEIEGIVRANVKGAHYVLQRGEGPGILFRVVDAESRAPLEAEVWFPSIETEDVHRRTTQPVSGIYRRLLLPGTYTCIVSKPGFEVVVLKDLVVGDSGWKEVNVELRKASKM